MPLVVVSTPPSQPAAAPLLAGDALAWTAGRGPADATPFAALLAGGAPGAPVPVAAAGHVVVDLAQGGGRTILVLAEAAGTGRIAFLTRDAAGAWSAMAAPGGGDSLPGGPVALAVNARGEAVVGWAAPAPGRRVRVTVAWSRAGAPWSRPKPLGSRFAAAEGGPAIDVGLDDRSRATVVWTDRGRIRAAAGVVNGRWAAPRGHGWGEGPRVAAAGSRTVAVWSVPARAIVAAGRGAWGLASPRVAVRPRRGVVVGAAVPAVAPDGSAVIAYTPQTLSGRGRGLRIAVTRSGPRGPWAAPRVLSGAIPPGATFPAPALAVATDGGAVLAWRERGIARARTMAPDGIWAGARDLGAADARSVPVAAADAGGTGRVAWVAGGGLLLASTGP